VAPKNVFSDRQNCLFGKSASFRCDGRLFHSTGPAVAKALSPKLLYVQAATHVHMQILYHTDAQWWKNDHWPRTKHVIALSIIFVDRNVFLQSKSKSYRQLLTVFISDVMFVDFYARQHVMLSASLLRRRRTSVRPSVTLLYCVKTTQRRIMKSSPGDILESLVSNEVILVPLGEEIPLERGHQRGVPP